MIIAPKFTHHVISIRKLMKHDNKQGYGQDVCSLKQKRHTMGQVTFLLFKELGEGEMACALCWEIPQFL